MRLYAFTIGNITEYALTAAREEQTARASARAIIIDRGYHTSEITDVSEITDATGVPYADYAKFYTEFYATEKYNNQRFGQAFLNAFYDNLKVKAMHYGSFIWQDNDAMSVINKLTAAGILDF